MPTLHRRRPRQVRVAGASPPPPPPPPPGGLPFASAQTHLSAIRAENHTWWQVINARADATPHTSIYGNIGQWNFLKYLATGDAAQMRKCVEIAWLYFFDANVSNQPNEVREHGCYFFMIYPWARDAGVLDGQTGAIGYRPTAAEYRAQMYGWNDYDLGNGTFYPIGFGDSDRVVTAGPRFQFIDLFVPEGERFFENLTRQQCGLTQAAGVDVRIPAWFYREIDPRYFDKAAGGEWLEAQEYNLGTVQLIHFWMKMLADGYGSSTHYYPSWPGWVTDAAESLMHMLSPDWLASTTWGDSQDHIGVRYFERVSLLSMYAGLLPAGALRTKVLNYFAQMMAVIGPVSGHALNLWRAALFFDPRELPASPTEARPTGLHVMPGVGLATYHPPDFSGYCWLQGWNALGVDHNLYGACQMAFYAGGEWWLKFPTGYQTQSNAINSMFAHGLDWPAYGGFKSATEVSPGVVEFVYHGYGPLWNVFYEWPVDREMTPNLARIVRVEWPNTVFVYDYWSVTDLNGEAWWPAGVPSNRQTQVNDAETAGERWKANFLAEVAEGGTAPAAITNGYQWTTKGGQTVRVVNPTLAMTSTQIQAVDTLGFHEPEVFGNSDWYRLTIKSAPAGTFATVTTIHRGTGTIPTAPPPPPAPVRPAVTGLKVIPTPVGGYVNQASGPYTVQTDPIGGTLADLTVTPTVSGVTGTFSPATLTLSTRDPRRDVTLTATAPGTATLSAAGSGLTAAPNVTVPFTAPPATGISLSGPTSGQVNTPLTYTVTLVPTGAEITGTVTVTPADAAGGTIGGGAVTLTTAQSSDTFTVARSAGATGNVSVTNDRGLSNPSPVSLTTSAPTDATDPFTRPDASTLGSPWIDPTAIGGISSNRAVGTYAAGAPGNPVVRECHSADAVVSVAVVSPRPYQGLVFRYSDPDNFWRVQYGYAGQGTQADGKLTKVEGGVATDVGTFTADAAAGSVLTVACIGTEIRAYLGAAKLLTATGQAFNQAATKHGVLLNFLLAVDDFTIDATSPAFPS